MSVPSGAERSEIKGAEGLALQVLPPGTRRPCRAERSEARSKGAGPRASGSSGRNNPPSVPSGAERSEIKGRWASCRVVVFSVVNFSHI